MIKFLLWYSAIVLGGLLIYGTVRFCFFLGFASSWPLLAAISTMFSFLTAAYLDQQK